jgi:predicted RNA-binding protein YlxR (DUF448 family)
MAAPVRMCVGCRRSADKASLLRIVRRPDGSVAPDPSGSAAGRGAYVHRDPTCVAGAVERGTMLRALRAGGDVDGAARLLSMIEQALEAR